MFVLYQIWHACGFCDVVPNIQNCQKVYDLESEEVSFIKKVSIGLLSEKCRNYLIICNNIDNSSYMSPMFTTIPRSPWFRLPSTLSWNRRHKVNASNIAGIPSSLPGSTRIAPAAKSPKSPGSKEFWNTLNWAKVAPTQVKMKRRQMNVWAMFLTMLAPQQTQFIIGWRSWRIDFIDLMSGATTSR